jgi:hypothetical protein
MGQGQNEGSLCSQRSPRFYFSLSIDPICPVALPPMTLRIVSALFALSFLTQCSTIGRLLQVPMRTINGLTRGLATTESEQMKQRAEQVEQRASKERPAQSQSSTAVAQR